MDIKLYGIKIIQIMWDRLNTIAEVKSCNKKYERGVYQIYGPHFSFITS